MGLKDLVTKTLTQEVSRENGISDEVVYTHLSTRTQEVVRCIAENIIYGDESRDKINDYVIFHGLSLSEQPSRGDTNIWNNNR